MEKRALLAFLLSLAVLFLWEMYFGPTRTPQVQQGQDTSTPSREQPVSPPPQTAPAIPPSSAPTRLPDDGPQPLSQQYQAWTLVGDLYTMEIVAPGARISSFQLKNYRRDINPQSPPLDLIVTRPSGYLPLAVDALDHTDWQLATRPFVSSTPSQTLDIAKTSEPVSFSSEIPGACRLTKSFRFQPGTYYADMVIQLTNLSSTVLKDRLGISFYFEHYLGAKEDSYNPSQLSYLQNHKSNHLSAKDLKNQELVVPVPVDWFAYQNNFFIQAFVPLERTGYQLVPRLLDENRGLIQMVYLTDPFELGEGQEKTWSFRIYKGPKDLQELAKAEHLLSEAVDYGWFSFLAKPLLYALRWLNGYTHNYGWAIIIMTVIIKIVFWPLTHKSYQSMQTMKKLQPKIAQVREKYKDDREKLNQELMMLYRTYKVNPAGGCLPMLLQIPVFFALYRMLNAAVELRHQPFALWINDLTAPDRLHLGFDIPYLGGLPVLTLLMGASMFIQQKMTPSSGDPRQEKMMLLMPVVFTFFFFNFPSGLVLYWFVNNVLSIAQQYWINRHA